MPDDPRSPLELLEALAVEEVEIGPGLAHLEAYTMRGLLTLMWHGARDARAFGCQTQSDRMSNPPPRASDNRSLILEAHC